MFVIALVGCSSKLSSPESDFLSLPPIERRDAILAYPLDVQVKLYLVAIRGTHPSDLALVSAVASNGAQIIPHLSSALVQNEESIEKWALLMVFADLQATGLYEVNKDASLMRLLEDEVKGMNDLGWKKNAADIVDELRAR